MALISQFDLFSITVPCHMRENAEQLKSISACGSRWGPRGAHAHTAAPEDTTRREFFVYMRASRIVNRVQ